MTIIKNFGTRKGYNETHVAFIIRAKYRRKGGAYIDGFVESTLDKGWNPQHLIEREWNE